MAYARTAPRWDRMPPRNTYRTPRPQSNGAIEGQDGGVLNPLLLSQQTPLAGTPSTSLSHYSSPFVPNSSMHPLAVGDVHYV